MAGTLQDIIYQVVDINPEVLRLKLFHSSKNRSAVDSVIFLIFAPYKISFAINITLKSFILFSDYFKPIANKIKFGAIVIGRVLKIMLRRNKNIELLHLDYSTKNLFESSFLVLHYDFKNALWYNIENLKKTTQIESIVFNLTNFKGLPIVFIVHGFFQKKVYVLNVETNKILNNKTFKNNISNLKIKRNFTPSFKLFTQKITMKSSKISIKKIPFIINHSSYHQTDFL